MAEKRSDKKNIFQGENVVVQKTMPQGGDVPSMGHVHEERDVPLNAILKATGYLVVFSILTCLAVWGLFEFYASQANTTDPQLSPLAERRQPPHPRLQSNAALDMAHFRQYEDSIMSLPGATGTPAGRSVTIDEAMNIIAERGLPQFPETASAPDSIPGASAGEATAPANGGGTSAGGASGAAAGSGATGGGATGSGTNR